MAQIDLMAEFFPDLSPPYDLILADPPWRFAANSEARPGKGARRHYRTMTLDEIAALPVHALAAPDCVLWMWATSPMLPRQLEVVEAWGFRFKTIGWWVKRTAHGKLAFGTGYILRSAGEPFIIATRGRPQVDKSVRSVIEGRVREHSRKPEEAFEAAERLMPGARRAELFSRERRPGWDAWGDEVGLFSGADPEPRDVLA